MVPTRVGPAPVQPTPAGIPVQTGELEVRVTDAPPEGVSNIVVTVNKIEVHKAGADGWITLIEEEKTFDLVLITGVEEVLGTKELAVGKYTQIRMAVLNVDVTLKPRGEQDFVTKTATVSSGELKVVRPFDVEADQTTVLTLDFDAAKSVVVTGRGDVRFKHVVKLLVKKQPRGKATGRDGVPEDTTPPVITITGVSDGEQSTGVTIVFSAADDVDSVSDLTVTATLNGDVFTSGTMVSVAATYKLKITAADKSGNEAEAEVEFEIVAAM